MNLSDLKPALSFSNMSVRQLGVFLYLSDQQTKLPLRVVASGVGIPKPGTSRAYDALCRFGLIKRERSDEDHRDVYAIITDKGTKLVKQLRTK
jgi:DNA-binding MarR family transcriptional regulator